MRLFICLFPLLLVGCLNFGNDVELVGSEITGKEMIQVSELTGLTFPNGTKSIGKSKTSEL